MSMAKSNKSGKGRKTATRLTSASALLRSFPSGKLAVKGKDVAGKPAVESAFEAMMKSARPAPKPAPAIIKVGASAKPRRVEHQQAREEWADIFDLSPWTNTKSPQTGVVRTQAAHRTVRKHGVGAVVEGDMINPWLSSSENPDAASRSKAEEMPPVEGKPGETASDDELDMDRLRKQLTGDFGRQAIRELQIGGLTSPDKGDPMTPRKGETKAKTKTKTAADGATAAPSKPSDWQTPAAAANAGKPAAQAKPVRKTAAAAKAGKRAAAGTGKRPAAKAGKRPAAKAVKQVAAKVDKQAAAGVDKQVAAPADKQAAQAKPALETIAAAQAKPAKKAAPETTSWTAKAKPPKQEEVMVEDLFKGVASFFGAVVAGISGLKKKLGKKDKADGR